MRDPLHGTRIPSDPIYTKEGKESMFIMGRIGVPYKTQMHFIKSIVCAPFYYQEEKVLYSFHFITKKKKYCFCSILSPGVIILVEYFVKQVMSVVIC
jgi:hypothetical protein